MLRTIRSLRLLRTLVVAATAIALSANVLEAVAPQVHEGDQVTVSAHDGVAVAGHDERDDGAGDGHPPSDEVPRQGAHVEHCGHAHLAALSSGPCLELSSMTAHAPEMPVAWLESVALRPDFRPPITLG